jgi:bifunctional non-homologous end joining protein LigD
LAAGQRCGVGGDFTGRFTTVAEAVRGLDAERALIDGEAVALREDRRSDLRAYEQVRGFMASLIAIDLLRLGGDDWRERPIKKRRRGLAQLIAGVAGVVFCEALAAGRGGFQERLRAWP